jgi:ATP-dependent Clp protease adaptor protein ClpS
MGGVLFRRGERACLHTAQACPRRVAAWAWHPPFCVAHDFGVDRLMAGSAHPTQDQIMDPMETVVEPAGPEAEQDTATATMVPEKKTERKRKKREVPRYHVTLWDSDDHTFEYVEKMLRELFGHTPEECIKLAKTVDKEGRAIVLTTTLEHAELKRDQVHAYGKDNTESSKGSMYATIEAAS